MCDCGNFKKPALAHNPPTEYTKEKKKESAKLRKVIFDKVFRWY